MFDEEKKEIEFVRPTNEAASEGDNDFELEPTEGESGDFSEVSEKIKKIKEKLKTCEKEKQDYLNNWQKERADFINYKKEESERMTRSVLYAKESFALDVLPVLDSYDLAMQNKEVWEGVDKNWRVGVEYIREQLLKILTENGLGEILIKEGDLFNPNFHQSVESIKTDDKLKDHTIARVLNKGYKIGERILRPARVNVFTLSS